MPQLKSAVALGTFDGIHAGHRAVLDAVLPFHSIAVTFDVPPRTAPNDNGILLLSPADKHRALQNYGIDEIETLNFAQVHNLAPKAFLEQLIERHHPSLISCGYNYRFGKNAAGDTALLADFCRQNGITLFCADPVNEDGEAISSTRIRQWIANGELERANRQILGGFCFTAPVIHGDARGRTLGFSTANQHFPHELIQPKNGVYVSEVLLDGKRFRAVTNLGHRPTYPTDELIAETYIFDFSGNLYQQKLTVCLLRFLREEKKFCSRAALTEAIRQDIAAAKQG